MANTKKKTATKTQAKCVRGKCATKKCTSSKCARRTAAKATAGEQSNMYFVISMTFLAATLLFANLFMMIV